MSGETCLLHSFDVFDTLITRPFARPTDLFRVLAVDLLGSDVCEADINAFVQARVLAESRARAAERVRDDIGLVDIYREFSGSEAFGRFADSALAREVELELASVVPIRSGIEYVRGLIAAGERVVFLSDMYLPAVVIADMLRRAGLEVREGSLYVSGEIGLSKHTGRIFDYVVMHEGVQPGQCLHRGDNWHPDVLRPRQRGWQALLFSESVLNRFEDPEGRASPWVATRAGGVSRASRLKNVSGNIDAAFLASGVIGPFLVSFVTEVLVDARERGIDTLYFVSRDGQILLKIARALQVAGLAPEIECRYLYGSRQAWFLPSVTEARRDLLEWAFIRGMSSAPVDILRRLEIDQQEIADELLGAGIVGDRLHAQLSGRELDAFVGWLLSPPIADHILARAAQRRALLTRYLGEQGLLDSNRRYALVDVGWTLKSQASLRHCIVTAAGAADFGGYYLGIVRDHEPLSRAGPARAFMGAAGDDVESCMKADWFFRLSTVLLVEHLFTLADHPSLARYVEEGGCVGPLFKHDYRDQTLVAFTKCLHEELVSYAEFAGMVFGREAALPAFREWSLENVRRFACDPQAQEVSMVAWLPTNREQSHDSRHMARLASPLSMRDIFGMIAHDLLPSREGHFSPDYAWNAGAAAISPAPVRFAYRTLRLIGVALSRLRRVLRRD